MSRGDIGEPVALTSMRQADTTAGIPESHSCNPYDHNGMVLNSCIWFVWKPSSGDRVSFILEKPGFNSNNDFDQLWYSGINVFRRTPDVRIPRSEIDLFHTWSISGEFSGPQYGFEPDAGATYWVAVGGFGTGPDGRNNRGSFELVTTIGAVIPGPQSEPETGTYHDGTQTFSRDSGGGGGGGGDPTPDPVQPGTTIPPPAGPPVRSHVTGHLRLSLDYRLCHVAGRVWMIIDEGPRVLTARFGANGGSEDIEVLDTVTLEGWNLVDSGTGYSYYWAPFDGRTRDRATALFSKAATPARLRGVSVATDGTISVGPPTVAPQPDPTAYGTSHDLAEYGRASGLGHYYFDKDYSGERLLHLYLITISSTGALDLGPIRRYRYQPQRNWNLDNQRFAITPGGKLIVATDSFIPTYWLRDAPGINEMVPFEVAYTGGFGHRAGDKIYPGAPGGRVVIDYDRTYGSEGPGTSPVQHPERAALLLDSSDKVVDVIAMPPSSGTFACTREGGREFVIARFGSYDNQGRFNETSGAVWEVAGDRFQAVSMNIQTVNYQKIGAQADGTELLVAYPPGDGDGTGDGGGGDEQAS